MTLRRYFSNVAQSNTLVSSVTASSTQLSLTSNAVGYPSNGPYTVRVEDEIILVANTTGSLMKGLTRGFDGTVAAAHTAGADVQHYAIADDFSNKWINPIAIEDTFVAYDDEFDDGDMSDWSEITPSGTASWTEHNGVLSVRFLNQASADCAGIVTSLNGLSYPLYVVTAARILAPYRNYTMFGPLFSSGTVSASNIVWNMPHVNTSTWNVLTSLRSGTFANVTTAHGTDVYLNNPPGWVWQRIDWIATNEFKGWFSADGVSWTQLGTGTATPSVTPTHYGLGVSTWGDTAYWRTASFEFFRVYTSKPTYWQD